MKAYFISGLAADSRVFKHIHLPDDYEMVFLDWIEPHKNETLKDYSLRLGDKIDSNTPFVLIGLSLGGMIAVEIAKTCSPLKTILISSVSHPAQLPPYFKLAGKLRLHYLLPAKLMKAAARAKRAVLGDKKDENNLLIMQVIKDSDDRLVNWGVDAILNWKTENSIPDHIHIHGSDDEILPIKYTKPNYVIKKADHMMIMNKANEINSILEQELTSL